MSSLISWASDHGGHIDNNIEFKSISNGNSGAFLKSSAQSPSENSPIKISLPISLALKILDAVEAFDDDFGDLVTKTQNVNCILKLFLAYEHTAARCADSRFRPYLESLPSLSQMSASPYLWAPEDLAMLKGSNLGSSLRENITTLVDEWWLIISVLPDSIKKPEAHFVNMKFYYEHRFHTDADLHEYLHSEEGADIENWTSFPNYMWASMIVKSRAFPSYLLEHCPSVNKADLCQPDAAMLLPVVDLLNHSPKANVSWDCHDDVFDFISHDPSAPGDQVFNNYGQKGNEELLLAYGFCLDDNSADSVCLKIKVPVEKLPELEKKGVKLPKLSDYTSSVVRRRTSAVATEEDTKYEAYKDGLVFFINKTHVPENLILLFQFLVQNSWEDKLTLRMKLSGLNYLRQALQTKASLLDYNKLDASSKRQNVINSRIYLKLQKKILDTAVKQIKHIEKDLIDENKSSLLTLKKVYSQDEKFLSSLLVTLGVRNYEDLCAKLLMDQVWLLYLIRCYNRDVYMECEKDEEHFLPLWIQKAFQKMDAETEMVPAEIVQFRELYESVIIPMNEAVPEIYNKGKWTVRELIVSTKVLDTIGFVRGKDQECILVEADY